MPTMIHGRPEALRKHATLDNLSLIGVATRRRQGISAAGRASSFLHEVSGMNTCGEVFVKSAREFLRLHDASRQSTEIPQFSRIERDNRYMDDVIDFQAVSLKGFDE